MQKALLSRRKEWDTSVKILALLGLGFIGLINIILAVAAIVCLFSGALGYCFVLALLAFGLGSEMEWLSLFDSIGFIPLLCSCILDGIGLSFFVYKCISRAEKPFVKWIEAEIIDRVDGAPGGRDAFDKAGDISSIARLNSDYAAYKPALDAAYTVLTYEAKKQGGMITESEYADLCRQRNDDLLGKIAQYSQLVLEYFAANGKIEKISLQGNNVLYKMHSDGSTNVVNTVVISLDN